MKKLANLAETLEEVKTVSCELVDAFEQCTDTLVHKEICKACDHVSQAKEALQKAIQLQGGMEGRDIQGVLGFDGS